VRALAELLRCLSHGAPEHDGASLRAAAPSFTAYSWELRS
jgi:hypothetical protein